MATGVHPLSEDFPWTIAVVDHPPRKNSAHFTASRKLMTKLVRTVQDWPFEPGPYEDHHGGALWLKDEAGWLCLQTPLGIEWSATFCADPSKVDRLRVQAQRVLAAFPSTLPGYAELGYKRAEATLDRKITTQEHVADWADSIFNASMPLPRGAHAGVLPQSAGYHHYPKPIVDIDHFRYDDFQLFVTDPEGYAAVVLPVAPRGSGDARVRLLAVHPNSRYMSRLVAATRAGGSHRSGGAFPADRLVNAVGFAPDARADSILDADDPLAVQAFERQ